MIRTFADEVIKSQIPVVVDFWRRGAALRALAPVTEKLAEVYAGKVKFCKINVDENPRCHRSTRL